MKAQILYCNALDPVSGAICGLPLDHTENHRGTFRHGVAQWPYDSGRERKGAVMDGITLIAFERRRQTKMGWTSEHDDAHDIGELAQAAAAYAKVASAQTRGAMADEFGADMMVSEGEWPFEAASWAPS